MVQGAEIYCVRLIVTENGRWFHPYKVLKTVLNMKKVIEWSDQALWGREARKKAAIVATDLKIILRWDHAGMFKCIRQIFAYPSAN